MACTLLCSSDVRVHVLHAYRNHPSDFELKGDVFIFPYWFKSCQICCFWAIIEMISGLDLSIGDVKTSLINSLITCSRHCPRDSLCW